MSKSQAYLLSVVVPVFNESTGLQAFHKSLLDVVQEHAKDSYEILYCDDGSTDDTSKLASGFHDHNERVKLVRLSRNFGKENALSAGIAEASGKAILMIDGDGQHPVELIPQFLAAWQAGAQVVIGVRTDNNDEGWFKRIGSRWFYRLFNRLTSQQMLPGSTDFRLIDISVRQAFMGLKETDRITRGLIDWLGFRREFIYFKANARSQDSAGYSPGKLIKLAANSVVSMTPVPLYLSGYLGLFITLFSFVLGGSVFIEQILLNDPWHWKFTGTAMLSILLMFLIGIVLVSQGVLSLYISHLHSQSKQRPLYIIDYKESAGIEPEQA